MTFYRYRWSKPSVFARCLEPFIGGQCLLNACDGELYRGKIIGFEIPDPQVKSFIIKLEWMCVLRSIADDQFVDRNKWKRVSISVDTRLVIDFKYVKYYSQVDECRLKIKGNNEFCRLYLDDDFTNLVWDEKTEEFVPYYTLHYESLRKAVLGILMKGK